jgi:hypothetical protein
MKQHMIGSTNPTANIAVNKSRVKLYEKAGEMPTYYLQKGQEFQIELFNPTTDDILAKISLNGKIISQGGLVLRPGQRVFLERFIDKNSKFLFDTYEVSNSDEVKEAIRNNGDFRVQFFKTQPIPQINYPPQIIMGGSFGGPITTYSNGNLTLNNLGSTGGYVGSTTTNVNANSNLSFTSSVANTSYFNDSSLGMASLGDVTLTSASFNDAPAPVIKPSRGILRSVKSKSIETGRVEEGSKSDQKLTTVDKKFQSYAFHTVAYKMLPISQKLVSSEDLNVKKYCTNCGAKLGKTDKFCSNCGTKA